MYVVGNDWSNGTFVATSRLHIHCKEGKRCASASTYQPAYFLFAGHPVSNALIVAYSIPASRLTCVWYAGGAI